MANNIGLRITLGGVTEVITDIKKLEDAIKNARGQLGTLSIGSDEFKKLSGEIRQADSALKDLKQQSEGIKFDKKLGEFAKVGGAITSGFAAATAAISLFGGNTEKVSAAAAKAQNLLTIAIAARGVAEGVTAVRTVALTVATAASTVASLGFAGALRALYAVLLANPYTAIIALIGLLVSAIITLSSSTENAAKTEEKYQEALKKSNEERARELKLLESTGASQETLLRKRVELSKEAENEAAKAFANEKSRNAFSEAAAKRRQEADDAKFERIIAENQLQTFYDEQAKKREEDSDNRRKKAAAERESEQQKLIDLRLQQLQVEEKYLAAIAPIQQIETDLTKTLENNIGAFTNYAAQIKLAEGVLTKYRQTIDSTKGASDNFYPVFEDLRLGAEGLFNELAQSGGESGVLQLAQVGLEKLKDQLIELNKDTLTPQQIQSLEDYAKGYDTLYSSLGKFNKPPFDLKEFEQLVIDLSLLQGKISIDPYGQSPEQIAERKANALKFYQEIETEFLKVYLPLREKQIKDELSAGQITQANAERLRAGLRDAGAAVFQTLVESGQQVSIFEQGVEKVNLQVIELNKKIRELAPSAKEGFVLENIQAFANEVQIAIGNIGFAEDRFLQLQNEVLTKSFDARKEFATDVEFLEYELAQQGIDISKFSYETRLKLLLEYYKKIKEARDKEKENEKRDLQIGTDEFQKTLDKRAKQIQQFQSVLNSLSQATQDYYSFQLSLLEKTNQKAVEQIVGDTDSANKKRLEQQQIYEQQRAALEKKSAKTSLQITLAQAVANTAAAITAAFKSDTITGFITSAIVAGINGYQISLIQSQISALDSFQRGGYIRGQGGLVVGPSHEFGGVKYQQGGVELEGGEAVLNRVSSVRYAGLLSQINQLGGGKPLVVNNAFDDSRMIEALAKQRNEPIRAYVIEQDITNSQQITKRLEQLSQI